MTYPEQLVFGIDVDGVLANFVESFSELIIEKTRENRFPAGYWYDPEYPPTWDWPPHYGYTTEQIDSVWRHVESSPHFWRTLTAFSSGLTGLRAIPPRSRVYFITSRVGPTALSQTQAWIREHLVNFSQHRESSVVVSSQKGAMAVGLKLNFFLDDHTPNANAVVSATRGACRTYLLNKPYNRHEPLDLRVVRADTVEDALNHFVARRDLNVTPEVGK